MPLAELQSALATMIAQQAAGQAPTFDPQSLNAAERNWLASLPSTRGFRVTCDIQRWWRETRLRSMARLTLAALGKEQSRRLLEAYLSAHLCPSLFFLPEAIAFLDFIANHTQHPHGSAIAQFERALLLARENSQMETTTIVEFAAPPETLLAALLQGQPLPPISAERFPVLVAADLPHFWRPLAQDE